MKARVRRPGASPSVDRPAAAARTARSGWVQERERRARGPRRSPSSVTSMRGRLLLEQPLPRRDRESGPSRPRSAPPGSVGRWGRRRRSGAVKWRTASGRRSASSASARSSPRGGPFEARRTAAGCGSRWPAPSTLATSALRDSSPVSVAKRRPAQLSARSPESSSESLASPSKSVASPAASGFRPRGLRVLGQRGGLGDGLVEQALHPGDAVAADASGSRSRCGRDPARSRSVLSVSARAGQATHARVRPRSRLRDRPHPVRAGAPGARSRTPVRGLAGSPLPVRSAAPEARSGPRPSGVWQDHVASGEIAAAARTPSQDTDGQMQTVRRVGFGPDDQVVGGAGPAAVEPHREGPPERRGRPPLPGGGRCPGEGRMGPRREPAPGLPAVAEAEVDVRGARQPTTVVRGALAALSRRARRKVLGVHRRHRIAASPPTAVSHEVGEERPLATPSSTTRPTRRPGTPHLVVQVDRPIGRAARVRRRSPPRRPSTGAGAAVAPRRVDERGAGGVVGHLTPRLPRVERAQRPQVRAPSQPSRPGRAHSRSRWSPSALALVVRLVDVDGRKGRPLATTPRTGGQPRSSLRPASPRPGPAGPAGAAGQHELPSWCGREVAARQVLVLDHRRNDCPAAQAHGPGATNVGSGARVTREARRLLTA